MIIQNVKSLLIFLKSLNGGTVPPFSTHPVGTVPPFSALFAGVPYNREGKKTSSLNPPRVHTSLLATPPHHTPPLPPWFCDQIYRYVED